MYFFCLRAAVSFYVDAVHFVAFLARLVVSIADSSLLFCSTAQPRPSSPGLQLKPRAAASDDLDEIDWDAEPESPVPAKAKVCARVWASCLYLFFVYVYIALSVSFFPFILSFTCTVKPK